MLASIGEECSVATAQYVRVATTETHWAVISIGQFRAKLCITLSRTGDMYLGHEEAHVVAFIGAEV